MATMRIIFVLCLFNLVFGQISTDAELPANKDKAYVDSEVNAVFDSIAANQQVYYKKYHKYFQGIKQKAETAAVISTSNTKFDRTKKPTDQVQNWADFGLKDISVKCSYECHVYQCTQGWGYELHARVQYDDGKVYHKTRHYGPEKYRQTKGWIEETKDIETIKKTKSKRGNL